MKKFVDFLNEAAKDAITVKVKSVKIGKSTEDYAGTHLKVNISGETVTFETPDGRQIVLTGAKELISATGLKDGQYASTSTGGFPAFNGETRVKYSKSAKTIDFLDIKVGMGAAFIGIDGNRQWKSLVSTGWNDYHDGKRK